MQADLHAPGIRASAPRSARGAGDSSAPQPRSAKPCLRQFPESAHAVARCRRRASQWTALSRTRSSENRDVDQATELWIDILLAVLTVAFAGWPSPVKPSTASKASCRSSSPRSSQARCWLCLSRPSNSLEPRSRPGSLGCAMSQLRSSRPAAKSSPKICHSSSCPPRTRVRSAPTGPRAQFGFEAIPEGS